MKISFVILTKNEEGNIRECLESVLWGDELIVVDDFSDDETIGIAKKIGAKVFKRKLSNDFSSQRNFALNKASGDWVLFLDADERISEDLALEIKEAIKKNNFSGFYLKRKDFFYGKILNHGETGNIKLLRLAKRTSGKWQRSVHEVWKVKGNTDVLKNPLYHYSHPSIFQFISQVNKFSSLHAKELYQKGTRFKIFNLICYPAGKFLLNYIIKRGFLDGTRGFVFAMMMSFHSFLARAKLKKI